MAPQSWANEEQDKLLHSMLPEYLEINAGTKDYGDFWAKVRQVWFQKYSECGALFPGKAESELNEEERSRVTEAMQKTLNVCQPRDCFYTVTFNVFSLLALEIVVPLEGQSCGQCWTPRTGEDFLSRKGLTPVKELRDVF
jgi:hypothetical protein